MQNQRKLSIIFLATVNLIACLAGCTGRRLILVDSEIHDDIQNQLEVLVDDWENDGAEVEIIDIDNESAEDIRAMLKSQNAEESLEGVLLVGEIPYASFQYQTKKGTFDTVKEFPTDYFYMELDGTWIDQKRNSSLDLPPGTFSIQAELIDGEDGTYDTYEGDRVPNIVVGRITPTSQMGDAAEVINTYLAKLHNYRASASKQSSRRGPGRIVAPAKAAFYMGPLHEYEATTYAPPLDEMYATVDLKGDGTGEPASNALFEDTLSAGYEWMTIWAEGNAKTMTVGETAVSAYTLGTLEIETDFFLLNSCTVGGFALRDPNTKQMKFIDDYVAGRMIFGDSDHGLVAITHTTGGMLWSNHVLFHQLLGSGKFTVGQAQFLRLLVSALDGSFFDDIDMGAVILGDPFLKPHSLE